MLDWGLRFKIIEGIVKGLLYLHEDVQVNIIHGDLKPANILLDARLNPKISNYETSKSFDVEQEESGVDQMLGTRGYMDSVSLQHGNISIKSDVYSLGITILVMLTGKRATERNNEGYTKLVDNVMKHWEDGTIAQILDENIVQSFEKEEEISITLNIAMLCVQYERELRPKVSDILMMLRGHLSLNLLNTTGITGLPDNIKDLKHLAREIEELKRATNNFSPENKLDLDCCKYLNWGTRLKIIQGIVQGLGFLHQISPQNIIHRDLKPANILLDKEMNPKISDFGISNFLQNDMTYVSTSHNYGTRGYMAPEYLMYGRFSTKSDIYSLGVMMLEIVTGKRAYDHYKSPAEAIDLPSYVLENWKGRVKDLFDKHVQTPTEEEEDQLSRIIDIALVCVDYDPNVRPNISQVLQVLSNPPTIALPEC
ncbi:hypothetical protein ZOSMA_174G00120 [Zostera marina]|uniref:Protein kinase domain-containing protein n=1 Tax=Zostera marina TaxID=29655 RepID=A0A0K9PS58_ZOSMR|nr:hypothetical protein ZOSMA_174G00120 [Zostera marina]